MKNGQKKQIRKPSTYYTIAEYPMWQIVNFVENFLCFDRARIWYFGQTNQSNGKGFVFCFCLVFFYCNDWIIQQTDSSSVVIGEQEEKKFEPNSLHNNFLQKCPRLWIKHKIIMWKSFQLLLKSFKNWWKPIGFEMEMRMKL